MVFYIRRMPLHEALRKANKKTISHIELIRKYLRAIIDPVLWPLNRPKIFMHSPMELCVGNYCMFSCGLDTYCTESEEELERNELSGKTLSSQLAETRNERTGTSGSELSHNDLLPILVNHQQRTQQEKFSKRIPGQTPFLKDLMRKWSPPPRVLTTTPPAVGENCTAVNCGFEGNSCQYDGSHGGNGAFVIVQGNIGNPATGISRAAFGQFSCKT